MRVDAVGPDPPDSSSFTACTALTSVGTGVELDLRTVFFQSRVVLKKSLVYPIAVKVQGQ